MFDTYSRMMATSSRPTVLLLGEPVRYNLDLYQAFSSSFEIIRPSEEELEREEFMIALREKRWGDFSAICRPHWNTGGEMGRWDAELITLLPKTMKVYASAGTGYDWVEVDVLADHGILYCNGAFASSEAVADMAIFHILSVFRNLTWSHLAARSGDVGEFLGAHKGATATSHNPRGHKIGIIGLGNIGFLIDKKAYLAFGMHINYFDVVQKSEEQESEIEAMYHDNLDSLLGACDCIVLATPAIGGKKLLDAARFSKFKPGSRFVNIARGSLVDEEALFHALGSGRIFAAGLDVHEFEPKVNPRFLTMQNVTLTSHNAGGALETNYGFEALAMQNIEAVLSGKQPLTAVNKQLLKSIE